jgi:hypothetical protein
MTEQEKKPLVWIEWTDAGSIDEWRPVQDMQEDLPYCVTVGFLMRETEDKIYVSGTTSDGRGCCTMIVPKVCIIARREIAASDFQNPEIADEDLRHG